MNKPDVVLASGSPRRKQLLEQMGIAFRVAPTEADETLPSNTLPHEAAEELARRKATHAMADWPKSVVVAADTLVAVDGRILGKPENRSHAVEMLKSLRGRDHEVVTGLCVAWKNHLYSAYERTIVCFNDISDDEIDRYVGTGEPMDKAGAYGIQGGAGVFTAGIHGCYYNVMGLPLAHLKALLCMALGENGYSALATWGEEEWQR
jgi:septum formation protein